MMDRPTRAPTSDQEPQAQEVEARGRKQEEKYARWREVMEQSKAAQRSGEGEGEK